MASWQQGPSRSELGVSRKGGNGYKWTTFTKNRPILMLKIEESESCEEVEKAECSTIGSESEAALGG